MSRDGQRIDVLYSGPNHHLWTSSWPNKPGDIWWSAPADLGGVALTSAPSAVSRDAQRIDVFYAGPNHHLWTSSWPNKPGDIWWSAPADLGGVNLTSGPGAGSRDATHIDALYRDHNGHLLVSSWPDSPGSPWWGAPEDIGVQIVGEPATVDGNTVFFRGTNNHLWRITRCTQPSSSPPPASVCNGAASVEVTVTFPRSLIGTAQPKDVVVEAHPYGNGSSTSGCKSNADGATLTGDTYEVHRTLKTDSGDCQVDVTYPGPNNHVTCLCTAPGWVHVTGISSCDHGR